ncbi:LysR family transcriptional regulator [Motiliproteus coralliicola]|uniref:LysR family transcriptional regulator n=1 Tax=Motiliproteus coralliicola TaxID=2283196 RepID=A0A369WSH8_9GAMM|nr:LysR family transcriptional regulator [Motiliproteus coralliicola]RDE24642.1 LysR family transcriptional regulator [Motiliproteus coralliicola]
MNIKGLRAFYLVVTKGSLASAGEALCLSQPAVSRLISVLEAELKLNLFHRSRRSLQLTHEGKLFFQEAQRILEGFDEIPQIVNDIKQQSFRKLRIVAMPRLSPGLAAPVIARYTSKFPNVQLSVDTLSRRDMEKWLSTKRYDVALVTLPIKHDAIRTEPLYNIRAEVLLPSDHRLAQKSEIRAEDLQGERMISLFPGLLLRQQLDDIFHAAGIKMSYAIEAAASPVACQLVRNGAGITVIDRLSVQGMDMNGLCLRPLIPARSMPFGLLYLQGNEVSPLAQDFIKELKTYLLELQDQWGETLELLPSST